MVSIRVPAEDVDVNAHPQKTEVRFRRSAQLLDLVTRMLAPHLPSAPAGDAYWDERIGGPGPRADLGTQSSAEIRAAPTVAQAEAAIRRAASKRSSARRARP